MDPTACLKEMLEAAKDFQDDDDMDNQEVFDIALVLADNLIALHEWIKGGGFLPQQWQPKESK